MSKRIKGITLEIGGDTTGLTKALSDVNKSARDIQSELKAVDKSLELNPGSTELLAQKQTLLANAVENAREKLDALKKAKAAADERMASGDTSTSAEQYRRLQRELSNTEKQLEQLEKQSADTGEKLKGIGSSQKSIAGLKSTFLAAATGAKAFLGTAVAAVKKLSALEEETREYREDMNKLKTGFEASGKSATTAKKAYSDFYGILGESDRAVEAVNHLAELTQNEKELSEWTEIAAGVNAKFTDSLPIEGLTEAANETAKTGKVTGVLADALNWVAGMEDTVNEKLAGMNSEQERASYLTQTLSELYSETGAKYLEANSAITANREAQAEWNDTMARMGEVIAPLKADIVDFGASALSAVATLAEGIAGIGDSSSKIEELNDTLAEARGRLENVTEETGVASEKIATWEQLRAQLDSGTLSAQQYKDAQARLKEVEQWFIDNYGSYITAEEAKNGIRDETVERLKEHVEVEKEIALLEMQSTMRENANKIPDIEYETELLKGKNEALTEQAQALNDTKDKLELARAKWAAFLETEEANDPTKTAAKIEELNTALEGIVELDVNKAGSQIDTALYTVGKSIDQVGDAISKNKDTITEGERAIAEYKLGLQLLGNVAPELVDSFRVTREGAEGELEKQVISAGGYYAQMAEDAKESYRGINDEILTGAEEQFNNTLTEYEKIGGNIPEGLRRGIEKGKEALKNGVKSFITQMKSWFTGKDAFNINSPSKWAEGIAAFVDEGLAIGFIKNSDTVQKSMRELFGMMEDERKEFTEDITLEEEHYNKELERIRAEGSEEANKAYLDGLADLADRAKEKRDFIREQYEAVVDDVRSVISDLEKETEAYRSGLSKTDLVGEDKYIITIDGKETEFTTPVLADLSGKRAELEKFIEDIDALKELGIDDTILEQIKELGGEEGGRLAEALLKATPEQRATFTEDFKKIGELSGKATAELFGDELSAAAGDLKNALDELAPDLLQTGEDWGHYLGKGIISKLTEALSSIGIMADYALPKGSGGTVVNYNTSIENHIQATPSTANEIAEAQRRQMEDLSNWGQIT